MPSSQNVSSYQSISLQFCLCRVQSRYTNTSQAMEENLHEARTPFKVHTCLSLEKKLVFLFITSSSKQVTFSHVQVLDQTQPSAATEKRTAAQPHGCNHTMAQLRTPSSQCLWIDLLRNFSTHVIQSLSNCIWNNVVLTEWGS